MAVQNGRDLLIKMDMTGDGSFETVAGLRASRLSFNAETVDVTTIESEGGWRELLGGAGMRSASISGSGVFRDADTDGRARQIFFDGEVPLSGRHPGFRHGRGAFPDLRVGIRG